MGAKTFHFKQFSISQDRTTHKVGTDGVLVGSWVNILQHDKFLLDIGAGSGLIALMLAQRSGEDVHIDAVEIDATAAKQAGENVARSPWPLKVAVIHERVERFAPDIVYDLVVSNPPYFVNSLHPPGEKRLQARHAFTLTFPDLLKAVVRLLSPEGRFAIILSHTEGVHFIKIAREIGLFPIRRTTFRARRHKPPERLLMEFTREEKTLEESEIVLYEEGELWTAEYKALTKDFYLRL